MPGIAGIISRQRADHCEHLVRLMAGAMGHQTFYVSEFCIEPELGVYSTCVSNKEISAASQVFCNEERDIAVLLAGECFVEASVRSNLKIKGHDLKCDQDWIVHLYEEQGEKVFEQLNGLFSGLIIDKRQGKVVLFNDRYGAERMYWCETTDGLFFASEAKALLSILPQLRQFDQNGLIQFLAFGVTVDWKTLFTGMQILPGASAWTFCRGLCSKRQYFSSHAWEQMDDVSPERFQRDFEQTFNQILPRYFEASSMVGISLTGGLDTRMIMACRPQSAGKVLTYTFTGQKAKTIDDRIAEDVARACGLKHDLIRLGPDFLSNFSDHVDETVFLTDGTLGLIGAHEVYFNRQARALAQIRLTGLFGSEVLRGVSTFKRIKLSSSLVNPEISKEMNAVADEIETRDRHPVGRAAFENIPWNLIGNSVASRSQVRLRTPFLDNDLVALAFRAPSGLRKSAEPGLRLVNQNDKLLSAIPTDRRIECKNRGLGGKLKRAIFEMGFKADYVFNEGMPHWCPLFDGLIQSLNSRVRFLGHHKYLHYRTWLRSELSCYLSDAVADARVNGPAIWNSGFLKRMAKDHINGHKNHLAEIHTVITLAAIDRLLLSWPAAESSSLSNRSGPTRAKNVFAIG